MIHECLCVKPRSILKISSGCRPVHIPDMDSACKIKASFLRLIYVSFSKGLLV